MSNQHKMKKAIYFAIYMLAASVAFAQLTLPNGGPVRPYFIGVPVPSGYFPDPYYTNTGSYQVTYDSGYLNSPYVSNPASNTVNVGTVMKFYPSPSGGNSEMRFLLTNSFASPTNPVGAQFGIWVLGWNIIALEVRSLGGNILVSSNGWVGIGLGWRYFPANIPPTTNIVMEARIEAVGWTVQGPVANLPVWVGGIRFEPNAPQPPTDPNFRIESAGTSTVLVWNNSRYPGYVVQESASPAGTFSDLAGYTASTNSGWVTAGIALTGDSRFFRLRSP